MESEGNSFEDVVDKTEEEKSQQTLQSMSPPMLWEPDGKELRDSVWKALGTAFLQLTVLVTDLSWFISRYHSRYAEVCSRYYIHHREMMV